MKHFNNALAAVSAEPRNILLAWCLDEHLRGAPALYEAFHDLAGETRFSDDRVLVTGNLEMLLETGIVRKRAIQGVRKRKMVEYGIMPHYAALQQLAPFAIRLAVDNEVSMRDVLGLSSGSKMGTAMLRFQLLTTLNGDNGTKSKMQLARELDEPISHVEPSLRSLRDAGLVDYTSYARRENLDITVQMQPRYRSRVLDMVAGEEPAVRNVAVALAHNEAPVSYAALADMTGYSFLVARRAAQHLHALGLTITSHDPANRSGIQLTEKGRVMRDALQTMSRIWYNHHLDKDATALRETERLFSEPGSRAAYARRAMEIYAAASPTIHRQARSPLRDAIMGALEQGPGTCEELGERIGKNPRLLGRSLRALRDEGRIVSAVGPDRALIYDRA